MKLAEQRRLRLLDVIKTTATVSQTYPSFDLRVESYLSLSLIGPANVSDSKAREKITKLKHSLQLVTNALSDMNEIEFGMADQASGFLIAGSNQLMAYVRATIFMISCAELEWKEDAIPTGRPRNTLEDGVALIAGECFKAITGRNPTVINPTSGGISYGPFIDFLRATFEILELKASPQAAAKKVAAALNSGPSEDSKG